jgi:beta-N-acetylhexosaminidase
MALDLPTVQLCGQLVVGGFDGHTLPEPMARALREGRRAGVILFRRNLESLESTHELIGTILDVSPDDLPPFVGVDEEGGRVRRLPPPVLRLPPMRALGAIGDADLVREAAETLGRELAAIGFNIDFAPVLDVDSNPKNPIIGDRAFSSDPEIVARLGRKFALGLQTVGVMACGKHFPGHGDTNKDSHVDLPFVSHGKERLQSLELVPFRAASHVQIAAMMTAHVVYEELDQGVPATLSRKIMTQLLRSELGFGGVLFSDDLEMGAITDNVGIGAAAVAAVAAGCDVLLVCKELAAQEAAHAALVEKAESDASFRQRCVQAVGRSLAARTKYPPRPVPSREELLAVVGSEASRAFAARLGQLIGD